MNMLLITESPECSILADRLARNGHAVGIVSNTCELQDVLSEPGVWYYSTSDLIKALEIEEPEIVGFWSDYPVVSLSMVARLSDEYRVRQFVTIGDLPVVMPSSHMKYTHLSSNECYKIDEMN